MIDIGSVCPHMFVSACMRFPHHLERPFLELHGVCQELQSKKLKHKKWPPGQMSVLRCFFLDFFQQIVHLNLVLFTYFDPILLYILRTHWWLNTYNPRSGEFQVLCSMGWRNMTVANNIRRY
jgi:hypothetical protein